MRLHLILKTCQCHANVMWLHHGIGCFVLLAYSHWLRKRCYLDKKNCAICVTSFQNGFNKALEKIEPDGKSSDICRISRAFGNKIFLGFILQCSQNHRNNIKHLLLTKELNLLACHAVLHCLVFLATRPYNWYCSALGTLGKSCQKKC